MIAYGLWHTKKIFCYKPSTISYKPTMHRLRRLRKTASLRNLIAQTNLNAANFVMPYFVIEGRNKKQPIESMPGIFRFSYDKLPSEIEELARLGVKAVILFGIPEHKDNEGKGAYREDGVIQKAVIALKKLFPDLIVVTDVCLCGYTNHGHCGIIKISHQSPGFTSHQSSIQVTGNRRLATEGLIIDNDETLKVLSKVALSHAHAGADIVAPSSMMDGQVGYIRQNLDKNGFKDTAIMGYSAKFASNFYGPFREAAASSMRFGDRKSYQIDFRNTEEPLREIEIDINEGADIVMVKPALSYLDIIAKAREKFNVPIAAYNVSGEYSMVKAYCEKLEVGSLKLGMEKEIALEILTAIKRAGADIIISYHTKEAAKWLRDYQP